MRLAVTGGSGLIGAATVQAAQESGHTVFSFDRSDGNDILGSLDALYAFKPDTVIHLAGVIGTHELFDNPHEAIIVNVQGTLRILDFCRYNNAGFVGITVPPVFPSVYTATKMCADRLESAWHREFGVPVSRVRAFNAYGPGQKFGPGHPQKIIPTFAAHAWAGLPIPIWGDGTQTVDLICTAQIGRILAAAAMHGDDVTFDAGVGVAWTVNEVADFVIKVTGSLAGVEHLPMRRGEEPTHIVATGEGWDRLRWQPWFDEESLVRTIESYRGVLGEK